LDYDSADEITDLDDEGILSTSKHMLTEKDRKHLDKFVEDMRTVQKAEPKPHDCLSLKRKNWKLRTEKTNSTVVEMELKSITKPT
jgi:hypothetical protein